MKGSELTRVLLKEALADAEAVVRETYGPEGVGDPHLVVQVAAIAAEIHLRIGEAELFKLRHAAQPGPQPGVSENVSREEG
jgi:hypothetical protein